MPKAKGRTRRVRPLTPPVPAWGSRQPELAKSDLLLLRRRDVRHADLPETGVFPVTVDDDGRPDDRRGLDPGHRDGRDVALGDLDGWDDDAPVAHFGRQDREAQRD